MLLLSLFLVIFTSYSGVTSGKNWVINTLDVHDQWNGIENQSMRKDSCAHLFSYNYRYSVFQGVLGVDQLPPNSSFCYFQPDFNLLCQRTDRFAGDPLGCHSKLAHTQAHTQAHITFSTPAMTVNTKSFASSSEMKELISWQCIIGRQMHCDGLSMCLTDECQCADIDVFYCADGVGCIAHANLCDGREDCRDGSDECMCDDVIQCTVHDHTYCVPRIKYCIHREKIYSNCVPKTRQVDCSGQLNLEKTKNGNNPMLQCATDFFDTRNKITTTTFTNFDGFEQFCLQNCDPAWIQFCGILRFEKFFGFYLQCLLPIEGQQYILRLNNLCDGVIDCKNGLDELGCPGRYYCKPENNSNLEWIAAEKQCDNKKDCSNGKDECDNCTLHAAGVASDQFMIQNKGMRGYMVAVSVLTVTINIFAGVETYRKETSSRVARVDKLFLLTLCAYDTLMGLCVGFTFIKATIYSGNYCLKDSEWRASLQCKLLGCCFTLAAHGSLLTVSMISLTRCYKIVYGRTIRVRVIAAMTAVTFIFNMLHSALPTVPLSGVQDIFRASMTFSDNPFATEYNAVEMKRKYKVYKGDDVTFPDTYTMLDQLNNISSKPGLFNPEELGYYSYSPLCIHNIYGTQSSLVVYKLIYMSVIVALLVATTISYITIVRNVYRTSQMAQQGAANEVNNKNTELSIKVVLVVGSQLFCWITVVILMAVYGLLKDIYAPNLLYELTAIVFLPMNSYLNPVFNSSLYKKILALVKKINFLNWIRQNPVTADEFSTVGRERIETTAM